MQIVERTDRGLTINGITDRELRSRNFKGEEKRDQISGKVVNSAGRRNFLLHSLPEEIAEELKDRGCDVKYTKLRDPNDVAVPYVSVNVSYFLKPVEAWMIANGVNTNLDESRIYMLDDVDVKNACIQLEFGKEKTKQNGDKYIPIFLSNIVAEVVPNYMREQFAFLYNQPQAQTGDGMPFDA